MLLGMDITVNDDDIVAVKGNLYAKSKKALDRLLDELRQKGYQIDDLRQSDFRKRDGVSVEQMEEKGWSMWYAKLPDIRFGKCGSCQAIIDIHGIHSHGHTCEKCGAVTYYEIVDGTTIRFHFIDRHNENTMFSPDLKMKAKRWDTENGFLYLYYDFLKNGGLFTLADQKAKHYLNLNKDSWELVEELRYPLVWSYDESAIDPMEINQHYYNSSVVKIWDGVEYSEWGKLPIPETISIYETWHWAPLKKSPTIHAKIMSACGQVSDKGYYYQDGRTAIYESVCEDMANYIRHFTTLDAGSFLKAWKTFSKSGPGFIDDFANWCHETPIVEDRPNVFNTINTAFNIAAGKPISSRELKTAIKGEQDPHAKDIVEMLINIPLV